MSLISQQNEQLLSDIEECEKVNVKQSEGSNGQSDSEYKEEPSFDLYLSEIQIEIFTRI